jgi:hypothetical protein
MSSMASTHNSVWGRPPLLPGTRQGGAKKAPLTKKGFSTTKMPARMGTCSSPWHPSTDSAAAALTNLAIPPRVSNSSNDEDSATNPLNTTLFNYTLDDKEVDPDLSQNLLSPLPPLPLVNQYANRVVESQLMTMTGLEDGDDDIGEEESDIDNVSE